MIAGAERTLARYRASLVLPILQLLPFLIASIAFAGLSAHAGRWFVPLITLVVVSVRVLYRLQFSWRLTDERLIAQRGILIRDTTVLRFDNITDMHVRKPLLAVLFGTGSVRVSTAGNDGYQITIFGQHNAERIERAIAHAKRAYLQRYRHTQPHHDQPHA